MTLCWKRIGEKWNGENEKAEGGAPEFLAVGEAFIAVFLPTTEAVQGGLLLARSLSPVGLQWTFYLTLSQQPLTLSLHGSCAQHCKLR